MHASLTRLVLLAVISQPALLLAASPSNSVDVVAGFVTAYNRHDVAQMMARCAENVRWLTVTGDTVTVEAQGRDNLRSAMEAHFAGSPNTRSEMIKVEGDGPMVVAIEKAMADGRAPHKAQCSASVYQLQDGRISNVWYFDAYRCEGAEDD